MATEWTQLEPYGFGLGPFGDPDDDGTVEDGIDIHIRGFGDELTKWTAQDG